MKIVHGLLITGDGYPGYVCDDHKNTIAIIRPIVVKCLNFVYDIIISTVHEYTKRKVIRCYSCTVPSKSRAQRLSSTGVRAYRYVLQDYNAFQCIARLQHKPQLVNYLLLITLFPELQSDFRTKYFKNHCTIDYQRWYNVVGKHFET